MASLTDMCPRGMSVDRRFRKCVKKRMPASQKPFHANQVVGLDVFVVF